MRDLIFIVETDNKESYIDVYCDVQERLRSNKYYYQIKEVYSVHEYKIFLREEFINELKKLLDKMEAL